MGDENKKDPKSSGGDTIEYINLKVLGQDNSVVQFRIKKFTPLKKLMNAYCERQNMDVNTVRFRFDGAPISEVDTPESLEMDDGDTIEVYLPQTGGMRKCMLWTRDSYSIVSTGIGTV